MAEGSNGTANGVATLERTTPLRLRRPRRVDMRLITGRGSTDSGKSTSMAANTIMPPPEYDLDWKREHLDTNTLQHISPQRLLEILANLSPEMSKGLWDYMRLLNPGWGFEAYNPGSETPNARARKIVEEVLDRIKQEHGSVDVVLGRMHMGAYMRGGYFAEAVFDDAGREMLDIATPDPASVRFKVVEDAETHKQKYQLGQWQNNKFVPLDEEEGVSYIPVDPFPGSPYGRPLVAPAMFSALFLLGLLHDLRRVISQQGWPRIHIQVLTEKLLAGMEQDENVNTPKEIEEALQAAIDEVRDTYGRLQPDDAYITGDEVEIKGPVAPVGGTNLTGIEGVIEVVERMLVRALKTMPLVLGITDGVSEANANRQWEILVAGVKALQHLAESMLERFFELACRMQGVQANIRWEFSEIRAAEAQRDALTFSQEIDNQDKLFKAGIIDQDEYAMNTVGHPPAEDGPLPFGGQPAPEVQPNDTNPEPGTANAAITWRDAPNLVLSRYSGSQASYRDEKARDGFGYVSVIRELLRDAHGSPRVSGVTEDGDHFRLWQIGRSETGEDTHGRYDVYYRSERTGEVPAATHRPTVGGRADDGRRDEERRGTGAGSLGPRYPRLQRTAGRNGRLVRSS